MTQIERKEEYDTQAYTNLRWRQQFLASSSKDDTTLVAAKSIWLSFENGG